nr:ComEC/Rec2 family competence protein [Propionibacterium sp.]
MDADRVDPRPVVLGAAAWAGTWAATSGEAAWWAAGAGLAAVLGTAAAVRRSRVWAAAALLVAVCLALGVLRVTQLAQVPLARLAAERAIVEVDAVLAGGSREFAAAGTRPAAWFSGARVTAFSGRGATWASGVPVALGATGDDVAAWRGLAPGTTVRVTVQLAPATPDSGLAAEARARGTPVVIAPPDGLSAAVERVRAGLRAACAGLPPDARVLVPALVVGDTSAMDADLRSRFQTTGLTHLTAVSGANLVLLLAFVRGTLLAAGVRGRWLTAALGATVFGFVALCLGEPSVVRAAAMGLVGLVALGSGGRGRQGVRYLAVAVLGLVLLDPWIARSLGFALSVTASAGLLWWAGRWSGVLSRWLPVPIAEAVCVPLAAQLATQPIVTAISGQISVAGLLANAVAGPLVGPATVLGFVAAGVAVLSVPLASGFAWLAGWCAQGLCWIARLGDALPGAAIPWPASWWAVVLVAVVCLLVASLVPLVFARRGLTVALAVALVATLARTPAPPGWPPARWSVVVCDVGQGDATVFRAGPGEAVLVDAGPDPRLLGRCLDQLGVRRVPLAVVTHLHADHVTGLAALAGRGVATVLTSPARTPASGDAAVRTLVAAGSTRATAEAGASWTAGAVRVDVLAVPILEDVGIADEGESSAENDGSLLLRVDVDGLTVLLAGDAEDTGQERLLRLQPLLDVDVLLVPHHGSARQSAAFLRAAAPAIALVSVGEDNDYGHPAGRTLRLVGETTRTILRTDEHGSIALARTPAGWSVTTQR